MQGVENITAADMTGAYADQQLLDVVGLELVAEIGIEMLFVIVVAFLFQHLLQHGLAEVQVFFLLLLAYVTADARLGFACDNKPLPVGRRCLAFRSRDLDLITIHQLRVERNDTAIYLRADRLVAESRVHSIGKINRRRTARQRNQVAVRREAEHLILIEFQLCIL